MKKVLCVVLAMIMCLSAFSIVASATAPMDIVVDKTTVENGGTEAIVNISIPNNPGLALIGFNVNYDDSSMTLESAALGNIFTGELDCNLDAVPFVFNVYTGSSNNDSSGTLVTLKFRLNQNCKAKQYDITIDHVDALNIDEEDVPYQVTNGYIKVNSTSFSEETSSDDLNSEVTDDPTDNDENSVPDNGPDYESEEDLLGKENNSEDLSGGENTDTSDKAESEQGTESENESTVITEHLFPDTTNHWAESFVNDAVKRGLFKGGADGNFNPDSNVTRTQFVTVLYRMAGSPSVEADLPFTDIDDQIPEFKSAIAWGYANGYINGTSEKTFDPNGTLTREAGMKILHFYSGGKVGVELQLYGVYDGTFKDSTLISSWAKQSVYWGVYYKLIAGTTADTLSPQGTATRAQLAKILVNYLNINQ